MDAPLTRPVWVRDARRYERIALEALQWRASLHNDGDRAALLAHPDAISLPQRQIDHGIVRVLEQTAAIVGFAVLLEPTAGACELDGLFVEPEHMRGGLGRRLIDDAVRIARARGATRIEVIANPHADAFYRAVGFTVAGDATTRFGPGTRMCLDVPRGA